VKFEHFTLTVKFVVHCRCCCRPWGAGCVAGGRAGSRCASWGSCSRSLCSSPWAPPFSRPSRAPRRSSASRSCAMLGKLSSRNIHASQVGLCAVHSDYSPNLRTPPSHAVVWDLYKRLEFMERFSVDGSIEQFMSS